MVLIRIPTLGAASSVAVEIVGSGSGLWALRREYRLQINCLYIRGKGVKEMAQAARITKETTIRTEMAFDALITALEDKVFCEEEQTNVIRLMFDAQASATRSDLAAQIAVGGMRGSIEKRHHQDLVNEFTRLGSIMSPLAADDFDPLDAA